MHALLLATSADAANSSRLARCDTVSTVLNGALRVLREQAALESIKRAILPLCANATHPTSVDMWTRFQQGINVASTTEPCVMPYHIGPEGEGGKTFCVVKSLWSHACTVVSVGSNGQVEFETAMHKLWRQCAIDIWDGTLTGSRLHLRNALPSYARFYPSNFGQSTYLTYNTSYEHPRHAVTMLKIDCEGCGALRAFQLEIFALRGYGSHDANALCSMLGSCRVDGWIHQLARPRLHQPDHPRAAHHPANRWVRSGADAKSALGGIRTVRRGGQPALRVVAAHDTRVRRALVDPTGAVRKAVAVTQINRQPSASSECRALLRTYCNTIK